MPPSSLAGIRHALERGADGVEIDIQLSRDSVPMLFHDVDLANRTGVQGYISQHTAAELTQLRYHGGWPYDWFQHERIATFDELLTELADQPTFPYLHLDLHEEDGAAGATPYVRSPMLVRALGRVLRQHRVPLARVLILTDYAPSLRQLRRELPGADLGLEINENFDQRLGEATATGVEAVVLSKYIITPERVVQAHARGLQVVVFGGRSRKAIERLLSCRPDGIEVDNVPVLLSLLGRRGRPASAAVPQAAANAPNGRHMR
ncbi:glycerophosphodiester phosphodiesterase [Hymenobacter sp. CRA2]|uniref:glycerophosphodiester phosphodiesterase n=1 Tax=Hymenobacter sp. CRA2 TaxID=1955620 RepID=UPI0015905221|nr:glycerophosphodiester phosphodiesterase family protein [Hymenobacter sp. CRA2]